MKSLQDAEIEIQKLNNQISKLQKTQSSFDSLKEKVADLEKCSHEKDETIKNLQDTVVEYESEIAKLKDELKGVKRGRSKTQIISDSSDDDMIALMEMMPPPRGRRGNLVITSQVLIKQQRNQNLPLHQNLTQNHLHLSNQQILRI